MNKIDAKDTIEKLAERFDYHVEGYKKESFNETQTRTDYINPLFEALGWDINNKACTHLEQHIGVHKQHSHIAVNSVDKGVQLVNKGV